MTVTVLNSAEKMGQAEKEVPLLLDWWLPFIQNMLMFRTLKTTAITQNTGCSYGMLIEETCLFPWLNFQFVCTRNNPGTFRKGRIQSGDRSTCHLILKCKKSFADKLLTGKVPWSYGRKAIPCWFISTVYRTMRACLLFSEHKISSTQFYIALFLAGETFSTYVLANYWAQKE